METQPWRGARPPDVLTVLPGWIFKAPRSLGMAMLTAQLVEAPPMHTVRNQASTKPAVLGDRHT